MTDLAPDHPAVLAALNAETQRQRTRVDAYADDHIREMVAALNATLPHLTADDLRDTDAGRALMAEAWHEGAMAEADAMNRMTPGARRIMNLMVRSTNPYRGGDA